MGYSEYQAPGEQSADYNPHLTIVGYIRPNPNVVHKFSIAEHVDNIIVMAPIQLKGFKNRRMGRFAATLMQDETGELTSIKDRLFASLMEDGYICTKPHFYTGVFKPHVSLAPNAPKHLKIEEFPVSHIAVTASRFSLDYDFLGATILHTRAL